MRVNFAHRAVTEWDRDQLLGPIENDTETVVEFESGATLAHILHMAGMFKSVSEAKRNGYDRPLPPGYSEHRWSRRRVTISILNVVPGVNDKESA